MRVATVSDIHGNRRAFQAVLADLRQVAPVSRGPEEKLLATEAVREGSDEAGAACLG